jgi:hypothetical protein
MRPIDPITLQTIAGQELRFLLSMGGFRRLKKKLGIKNIGDLMAQQEDAVIPLLYEALLDKGEITEDEFAELLPANLTILVKAVAEVLGVSLPDERPIQAEPTTTT